MKPLKLIKFIAMIVGIVAGIATVISLVVTLMDRDHQCGVYFIEMRSQSMDQDTQS